MEELTWFNSQLHQKSATEKIARLNEELVQCREDLQQRDQELAQLKVSKEDNRSLEKISNGTNDDGEEYRTLKKQSFQLEEQLKNSLLVPELMDFVDGKNRHVTMFFLRFQENKTLRLKLEELSKQTWNDEVQQFNKQIGA